jgi:hypothetical protein
MYDTPTLSVPLTATVSGRPDVDRAVHPGGEGELHHRPIDVVVGVGRLRRQTRIAARDDRDRESERGEPRDVTDQSHGEIRCD